MPQEADSDKYRYYTRDHKGTVDMMTDDDENVEEYNYDAWGEHYDTSTLPASENNIQFAGKFVETFADQATPNKEVIYENGVRHYWPIYGRFLQRDPNCYFKMPSPSRPKTANPYIFADNDPVMKDDPSGFETMVRGAKMGSAYFTLGTKHSVPWDQLFNCCGSQGFYTGLDDLSYETLSVENNNRKYAGTHPYSWYQEHEHWNASELCSNDALAAQPNESCKNITAVSASLACIYLKSCEEASCNFTPFDSHCECGVCTIDVGYDSTPLDEPLVQIYDRNGNMRLILESAAKELLEFQALLSLYQADADSKAIYGWGSSTIGAFANVGQWFLPMDENIIDQGFIPHYMVKGCVEMQKDIRELMLHKEFEHFTPVSGEWIGALHFQHHWMNLHYHSSSLQTDIYVKFDVWTFKDTGFEFHSSPDYIKPSYWESLRNTYLTPPVDAIYDLLGLR